VGLGFAGGVALQRYATAACCCRCRCGSLVGTRSGENAWLGVQGVGAGAAAPERYVAPYCDTKSCES
jgi:hypothetical protein